MSLTDVQIRQAKPREKRYVLSDDNGLILEVLPTGKKRWRMRYWQSGKEHKATLGGYPALSLSEARQKRDALQINKERGLDPKAVLRPAETSTFEAIAREWHEKKIAAKTPRYVYKVLSILQRLIFPSMGHRNIREVTAPQLLLALQAIESRGLNDTASTALQICGQIFRYAVASGYVEQDITLALRGALAPVVVTHNASITDPTKVREFIRAMTAFSGTFTVEKALWFTVYVFQRPGEIRHAEWTEINWEAREWRIPAEKMKARRMHLVPLSDQAYRVLEAMRPISGNGKYIFPSIRTTAKGDVPMSENTIAASLRRLGFAQHEMSAHGFRSMASTLLHEQGWPNDVIERQLAHIESNSTRAAYDYSQFLPERRKMMQAWADFIDEMKS